MLRPTLVVIQFALVLCHKYAVVICETDCNVNEMGMIASVKCCERSTSIFDEVKHNSLTFSLSPWLHVDVVIDLTINLSSSQVIVMACTLERKIVCFIQHYFQTFRCVVLELI